MMLRWLIVAAVLLTTGAQAHSKLTGSVPMDGAALLAAPEVISLAFNKPIRMVLVSIVGPDGGKTSLEATEGGFAKDHSYDASSGGTGLYSVNWRGFSEDGHLLRGSFQFEVK